MVKEQTVPVAIHVRQGNYTKWYTLSVFHLYKGTRGIGKAVITLTGTIINLPLVSGGILTCSYHNIMRKAITPTGTLSAFHLTREIAVSSHNTGYVTMAMKLRDNYHNRHHDVVSLLGAPLGQL